MENERLLSERLLSVDEMHADYKMKPLGELLISQDAKSIAARDKWWRGLLQEVNEANDLKDLQERFAHLLRYTADLEVKQ